MEKRKRRSFSPEFKNDAACLVLDQDYSYAEASRALEVHENTLRIWVKQLESKRIGITPRTKSLNNWQHNL